MSCGPGQNAYHGSVDAIQFRNAQLLSLPPVGNRPVAPKSPIPDPRDLVALGSSAPPTVAPQVAAPQAPAPVHPPVPKPETAEPKAAEPAPFTRKSIPFSFEEARTYARLRAENPLEAQEMLQGLHLRHPDSAWLAAKIPTSLENIGEYERNVAGKWKDLGEARKVAEGVAGGRQLLKLEGQGINHHEARAIYLLSREQPVECEILAADLAKRGDKARWMSQQARQGPEYVRPIGEGYIKGLNEHWSQQVSAFKLIAQLEKQPPSADPVMTFSECRSLAFLHNEGYPEAGKMRDLLQQRNTGDGWIASQVLKKSRSTFDEFTTQDFHGLQNRAQELQGAYGLLQQLQASPSEAGDWKLDDREIEAHQLLRYEDPTAAAQLGERLSARGPWAEWALERSVHGISSAQMKEEWATVSSSRELLAQPRQGSLSQAEAQAVEALASLSPADALAFQEKVEAPEAQWICQKIIDSGHSTQKPTLQELQQRWDGLEQAEVTLAQVDQGKPEKGPISWDEAQALQRWRTDFSPENHVKSKQLLTALASRHPDATWFCENLSYDRELTPESFASRIQEFEQLSQARQQIAQRPEGAGPDLSLNEANAYLTIHRLGQREEQDALRDSIASRSSRSQLALSLLPKDAQVLSADEFAAVQAQVDAKAEVLALHQAVTSSPQKPVPEGQMPFTKEEISALIELQESSWALSFGLRQALIQRSDFAKTLPTQKSEWAQQDLGSQLTKLHDCWLLGRSHARLKLDPQESQQVRERYFNLGSWQLEEPLNLTRPQQADNFVRIWQLFSERPDPAPVLSLAQLPGAERLPFPTLASLRDRLKAGGSLEGLTAETAQIAARAWQVDASLSLEKALELGPLPLAERLNGGPGPFNKSQLVLQLPAEKLPLAVEVTQGRSLNVGERLALYSGLRQSPEPQQALLNLKGAAFKEAYQAIASHREERLPEGELTLQDYQQARMGWEGRGAAALALTFRGSWRQWLDAQARIRGEDGEPLRTVHDVVDILPLRQLPGLDSFLLKNSHQKLPELSQIIGRWDEIGESERALPFDEVLAIARARIYPHMNHAEFGAEAAKWGIPEQQYAELESRFMASQQVASPFAELMDKRWTQGDLVGRFLPREDVRGLFLGNHTNCCQHPTGAGATCAYHGQESPRAGFFVLENGKGEVVVQSWTWISDSGGLVFDNVEGRTASSRSAEVRSIYQAAADELVEKYPQVTMGLDHGKLPTEGWPATTAQVMSDFDGYSDADRQVLLRSSS